MPAPEALVVVGASAGGGQALRAMVAGLPDEVVAAPDATVPDAGPAGAGGGTGTA